MELDWLQAFADAWRDRVKHGRTPHAVLLTGPVGVGKRAAARWMAASTLGIDEALLPSHPQEIPEHADLRWVAPLEDKQSIGIEQIRELIHEMTLTSYEGGGKVAVIEPANTMTVNAANSLLKTLEEPSGDALLILVADRVGKLPATIFSRCQRIDLAPPAEGVALGWLDRLQPGRQVGRGVARCRWGAAGGDRALDDLETSASMARDLNALGQGHRDPRWKSLPAGPRSARGSF